MSIDDQIDQAIEKHGWYALSIADGSPPFLYTIGLSKTFDHPELVVFGLQPREAYDLTGVLIGCIADGERLSESSRFEKTIDDDHLLIGFRNVHPTQQPLYLGYAMSFCRRIGRIDELKAMQIFWSDASGIFPFEAGCDIEVEQLQPRLDIPLSQEEIEAFEREYGD